MFIHFHPMIKYFKNGESSLNLLLRSWAKKERNFLLVHNTLEYVLSYQINPDFRQLSTLI